MTCLTRTNERANQSYWHLDRLQELSLDLLLVTEEKRIISWTDIWRVTGVFCGTGGCKTEMVEWKFLVKPRDWDMVMRSWNSLITWRKWIMWPTGLLPRNTRGCSRLVPKWKTGSLWLIGRINKLKIPSMLFQVHWSGLQNHRALQIADKHGGPGRWYCMVPLSLVTKHITNLNIWGPRLARMARPGTGLILVRR